MQSIGPNVFEGRFKIGVTGTETFHFARDQDWEQQIYPAHPLTQSQKVPVRGPDPFGKGKDFVCVGNAGEKCKITLSVRAGKIMVALSCGQFNRQWESAPAKERKVFALWSSAENGDDGKLLPMPRHEDNRNVFEMDVELDRTGIFEFQVRQDGDEKRSIYPEVPGLLSGEAFCEGPNS